MSDLAQQLRRFREDGTVKKALQRMKRNAADKSWDHPSWESAADACLKLYEDGYFYDVLSTDDTKDMEQYKNESKKFKEENIQLKEEIRLLKMKVSRQKKIKELKEESDGAPEPSEG